MKDARVFMACFFGALIGGLVTREAGSGLWWVGSIVGFVVGYLGYEFRQVIDGVRKTWNTAVNLDVVEITKTLLHVLVVVLLKIVCLICAYTTIFLFFYSWGNYALLLFFAIDSNLLEIVLSSGGYMLSLYLLELIGGKTKKGKLGEISMIFLSSNPLVVTLYWLPRGIFWMIKKTPSFFASCWKFTVTVFKLIHSDVRLLCGVDAAIGAGVGYFVGDALLGALFGGLFGLLNYKVVRTYLLKPVTAQAE